MQSKILTKTEYISIIFKFIFSLIQTGIALLIPFVIKNFIDTKGAGNAKYIILIVIVYAVSFLAETAFNILITRQKYKLIGSLQNHAFTKITHLKMERVQKLDIGEMTELFSTHVNRAGEYYFETFPSSAISFINTIACVGVVIFLDFKMTLLIMLILGTMVAVLAPLAIYTAKFTDIADNENANLTGFLEEVIRRIPLIKASTNENYEQANAKEYFEKIHSNTRKSIAVNALLSPLMGGIVLVFLGSIIILIAFRVSMGYMTGGTLTAFLLYILKVIIAVIGFVFKIKEIVNQRRSLNRLKELLMTNTEEVNQGHMLTEIQSLEFKSVDFSYNNEEKVLHQLSFYANKGESLAIVGASGSGKSTILSLIEGFYQPTKGDILLNGNPYDYYSLHSIRKNISYVSQNYNPIGQSIKENLTYGLTEKLDEPKILELLGDNPCFDFIIQNGLDYRISQTTANLSGGQLQRLAIARAYLKNSDIWLLDEATANLDAISEKAIVDLIAKIKSEKIIITVAHRLSTIVNSDKIIVMQDGKITGLGSHEQLLSSHGYYRELVENQFIEK